MNRSEWRKSSFSEAASNCVEVRAVNEVIELRESDDGDVIVRTSPAKFAAFIRGAKAGEFDHFIADA
ncbi:DUF397 domain-containing protein [Kitasatospora sp. NPDC085464]|uniref:DUF397 domain-containing protein n=1 Tax=Kitasatospora sp. NPDC085464 TaxID=3364063 RepID=UPI0037C6894F